MTPANTKVLLLSFILATIQGCCGNLHSRYPIAVGSLSQQGRKRLQRKRHIVSEDPWDLLDRPAVVPAAASTKTLKKLPQDMPDMTYADLSPLGKIIAGTVEVGVTTLLEYMSGFLGGYVLGTITDVPRLLFTPTQPDAQLAFFKEVSQRFLRVHQKSFRWARNWGGISAAFGGFRVGAKVLRGGVEDEWNTVFSSMAAGAYFARAEGPQAMLKGAVMYGGLMYLLSGGLGSKKQPFEFEEQPIDF